MTSSSAPINSKCLELAGNLIHKFKTFIRLLSWQGYDVGLNTLGLKVLQSKVMSASAKEASVVEASVRCRGIQPHQV